MNDINEKILKSIKTLINQHLGELSADRTVTGKIIAVLGNGKYTVEIQKNEYMITSCNDTVYAVNDTVYVCFPQGNALDRFIIGKKR